MTYPINFSEGNNLNIENRPEQEEEVSSLDSETGSVDSFPNSRRIFQDTRLLEQIAPSDHTEASISSRDRRLNNYYNLHSIPTLEQYYSEEARIQPTLTFEEYRRTTDYQRDTAIDLQRQHIQELRINQQDFIGISPNHPVPERIRYQQESQYLNSLRINNTEHNQPDRSITTTVRLQPYSYPVFEFIDGQTNRLTSSAFPSARDERLDWNTRIILQALEVSFSDPDPTPWEEFYE